MKAENAELQGLLNELNGFFREVLSVAHEGKDHSDGESIRQREPSRKINGDNHLKTKDQIVDGGKGDLGPPQTNVGICNVSVTIKPLPFPFALTVEKLETLDGS